ncbi:MAG: DUF58 domain-containing protein [Chloroflexi bacterium]|nr:DUF58 domain-containing protein [Chloroflexota bacterium]
MGVAPGLLDEAFLRKLDRLSLITRRARAGLMKGDRRSTKRGSSVEFADYRNYAVGDDPRQIDWNIYARLDRLFVKLFEEEEEASFHILVDASKSMDWGRPNKFLYARRVAAALGYIALSGLDRLAAAALRGGDVEPFPLTRGRSQALRYLGFLSAAAPGGVTNLDEALTAYARRSRHAGTLVLISDLLAPAGFFDGLRNLQSRGYEISVVHVLAPDEEEPELAGDLQLIDVETGEAFDVSVDANALSVYRQRLQAWKSEIRAFCHGLGIGYVPVNTGLPFEELILHRLRQRKLVK